MREKLGNPKNTIEVIQKYQFAFQKKFGQNFLIDPHVLDKIIGAAGVTKEDMVLEIGPGIGTMTQYLAEAAREVVAVEIDNNLIPILKETLAEYDNVTVINEDILKVDIKKNWQRNTMADAPSKVVANLPYYITTPIIMGLFESNVPIDNITWLWCRKRWQTACRWDRDPKIRRCPWQSSITLSRISWQMCRRTVSFRVRM